MKKFKILALALVIGTTSLFATNAENSADGKKEIRTQIESLIQAANFIIESDVIVNITFTFSSEGEIVVLKVDCEDCIILDFVRENLNYKKIENPGVVNKLYTIPLKLKAA